MSLNKSELVAKIAAETGQSQAAVSNVLDGLFAAVSETVAAGGQVAIPGWLSFETSWSVSGLYQACSMRVSVPFCRCGLRPPPWRFESWTVIATRPGS